MSERKTEAGITRDDLRAAMDALREPNAASDPVMVLQPPQWRAMYRAAERDRERIADLEAECERLGMELVCDHCGTDAADPSKDPPSVLCYQCNLDLSDKVEAEIERLRGALQEIYDYQAGYIPAELSERVAAVLTPDPEGKP